MKRVHLALAVLAGAILIGESLSAQPLPTSDHYLSYRLHSNVTFGGPVTVSDQFIPITTIQIGDLERLLNPVSQEGEAFVDSTAHLTMWVVVQPAPNPARQVRVINKFGDATWGVSYLQYLLAPARKNQPPPPPPPDNINHFLCYHASGPDPNRTVSLRDQFRTVEVEVGRGVYLCAPCRKEHDGRIYPIVDPDVHLAVYEVDTPFDRPNTMTVDQFGQFVSDVVAVSPEYLFVPSRKEEPVPVDPGTWGRIKSIYQQEGPLRL